MNDTRRATGGRELAAGHDSLALGVPPSSPGTLFALALAGGVTFAPKEGRTVLFGRDRPEVHVCIGENDRRISRQHGRLTHHEGLWWISTTGRVPVRLPGSRLLFPEDKPIPLAEGYTPMFVHGSSGREHVMEIFVAGRDSSRPTSRHADPTQPPKTYRLSPVERLVLVVLGQRYLMHEAYPQPLSYLQTARHLGELQPDAGWGAKRIEHLVAGVRAKLSREGVAGLTSEEVGEPVGNMLNHNLIRELLESTTLAPPDVRLLSHPGDS
ncbi:FHA domain-containing protein [Kutzneria sp. NPDC052558]|uniref:FHA domain-containing protein n=1 Tax=Kutzneria sp. NPDC052558 TaxID=3364121 RepID=UPI0037CBA913